jgi:hypothetical protein
MNSAPRLTWITRQGYGFGAIVTGVKSAAFSTYLLLFYNQVIGVPAAVVGTAIALTLVVDAFVDPFIGRWSCIAVALGAAASFHLWFSDTDGIFLSVDVVPASKSHRLPIWNVDIFYSCRDQSVG